MTEYRNVSGHPEDYMVVTGEQETHRSAEGRIVGTGETFELDEASERHEYNKAKIDEGNFLEVTPPEQTEEDKPNREQLLAEAKDLEVEGNLSKMRNDQLQTAINKAKEQKGGDA